MRPWLADLAGRLAAYLPLTGGTMAGDIAMGANKVTGLAAGTATGDAARYDELLAAVRVPHGAGTVPVAADWAAHGTGTIAAVGNPARGVKIDAGSAIGDGVERAVAGAWSQAVLVEEGLTLSSVVLGVLGLRYARGSGSGNAASIYWSLYRVINSPYYGVASDTTTSGTFVASGSICYSSFVMWTKIASDAAGNTTFSLSSDGVTYTTLATVATLPHEFVGAYARNTAMNVVTWSEEQRT